MNVRKLKGYKTRVETGPIRFGNDWPGTFIRGDNAAFYAWTLRSLLKQIQLGHAPVTLDVIMLSALDSLASDLEASRVPHQEPEVHRE